MAGDFDTDSFEVEIEEGDRFRGIFQSYKINSNYMTPTDAWDFVVYNDDNPRSLRRTWRPLQPVKLYIAGVCQLVGRIDGIEGTGESGAALRVFGRDYLADIVDATVDPQFKVQKGWTLEQALLALLRPFGITEIRSDNTEATALLVGDAATTKIHKTSKAKRKPHDVNLEDFKAQDNLGVFEFINKILARQGFVLLPTTDRNAVIIDSPNYGQSTLFELARPGNVTRASAKRDYSNVPTLTIARGRADFSNDKAANQRKEYKTFGDSKNSKGSSYAPIAEIEEVQRILSRNDSVSAISEELYDPKSNIFILAGTLYRPLFYKDQDARNQEQLDHSVTKMVAERLRDTLTYECTVRGHVNPVGGGIYSVDTLADISDTIEDVYETMWCFDRTFQNDGSGPETELKFLRPASYILTDQTVGDVPKAGGGKPKPQPPNGTLDFLGWKPGSNVDNYQTTPFPDHVKDRDWSTFFRKPEPDPNKFDPNDPFKK